MLYLFDILSFLRGLFFGSDMFLVELPVPMCVGAFMAVKDLPGGPVRARDHPPPVAVSLQASLALLHGWMCLSSSLGWRRLAPQMYTTRLYSLAVC